MSSNAVRDRVNTAVREDVNTTAEEHAAAAQGRAATAVGERATAVAQGHATGSLTPVPQSYTHKTRPEEVLLRDWERTGPDAFTVTAQWPRDHAFYRTRHGLLDPMLLSETIRQTLPLLSHGAYAVPLGHQLLWQDLDWHLVDPAPEIPAGPEAPATAHTTPESGPEAPATGHTAPESGPEAPATGHTAPESGPEGPVALSSDPSDPPTGSQARAALYAGSDPAPALVELRITCPKVTYRRDRAAAIALRVEVLRDGAPFAVAHSRFTIQDRAVYERLRGRYADIGAVRVLPLSPPASPRPVGRDGFEDVVLSPTHTPDRWQLRTDTTHPILFDHPVDHAPGMLLLEAARQAAQALAHPEATVAVGMESVFTRYAELDAPCWILADALAPDSLGRPRVRVTARQNDRDIFTSTVTLAPVPDPR
ncbi:MULTISPECIES: ScbA/BarX family gamma-butyrolactone biosynthesis protein [unclassified Streptomyces]|uniref:ScbA/BarX family gamma-butyrolactone biosynthesis protein n=1 Tax=unclassified Streptomyces TaxID=2593676 RepID=UPI003435EC23